MGQWRCLTRAMQHRSSDDDNVLWIGVGCSECMVPHANHGDLTTCVFVVVSLLVLQLMMTESNNTQRTTLHFSAFSESASWRPRSASTTHRWLSLLQQPLPRARQLLLARLPLHTPAQYPQCHSALQTNGLGRLCVTAMAHCRHTHHAVRCSRGHRCVPGGLQAAQHAARRRWW